MSKKIKILSENMLPSSMDGKKIIIELEENYTDDFKNGISLVVEDKDTDKLLINSILSKEQVLSLYEYLTDRIVNYAKSN